MTRRSAAFWTLGLAAAAYIGLPYLLAQRLGLGTARQGKWGHDVLALTFDDGPDPLSTPAVLDALRAAGAVATFFVMVPGAEAHPELLTRMREEGHQIELHAVRHRHAWGISPVNAYLEPQRGAARLARLGYPPRYHRPPHGAYTLSTLLGQRRAGLIAAHWNVEAHDWHPAFTAQRVTARVLQAAHPGALIVMHDAGPGAVKTVEALPGLLTELKRRGYSFATLDDLPGFAPRTLSSLPRLLARWLDTAFDRVNRLEQVAGQVDAMLRVGRVSLPLPVTLEGGLRLERGTPALEIHVNNPLLVDLGPRLGLRRARQRDFPALAAEWQRRPEWQPAQAIFCLSSVTPLLTRLGLETHPLPGGYSRRLRSWANILRRAYGNPPNAPEPKLSILGREAFLARYGEKTET